MRLSAFCQFHLIFTAPLATRLNDFIRAGSEIVSLLSSFMLLDFVFTT